MACFYCKGDLEDAKTTYMEDLGKCIIIIKNVPCRKCTQCGEEFIDVDTAQKIEKMIDRIKDMITEIAVLDFDNQAA